MRVVVVLVLYVVNTTTSTFDHVPVSPRLQPDIADSIGGHCIHSQPSRYPYGCFQFLFRTADVKFKDRNYCITTMLFQLQ